MSASLARTVFRPSTAATAHAVNNTSSACPIALFSSPASASRPSGSARTANTVAHLAVGAALFASAYSFASHPDTLFFDHPPRSAISWQPVKHIAAREAHAPTSSRSSPSSSSTSFSSALPSLPTPSTAVASPSTGVGSVASELRSAAGSSTGA